MLNYVYLLPAQQMRVLHTQTYIRNRLKNSSKDCLKMKPPPSSQLPQAGLSLTSPKLQAEVSRNRNPLQLVLALGWWDSWGFFQHFLKLLLRGSCPGLQPAKALEKGECPFQTLYNSMVPMLSNSQSGAGVVKGWRFSPVRRKIRSKPDSGCIPLHKPKVGPDLM